MPTWNAIVHRIINTVAIEVKTINCFGGKNLNFIIIVFDCFVKKKRQAYNYRPVRLFLFVSYGAVFGNLSVGAVYDVIG